MSDVKAVSTAGRRVNYPYTILGKVVHFPWKHYWKYGRGFRYHIYAFFLSLPIIWPIHKFVNSPANVEEWKRIRAARKHDVFAPPTEYGSSHH